MKGKNTKRWYYSSFLAPSPRLHLGVVCFSLRGNWASLSKPLRKAHFHSCRNAVRSFPTSEPLLFHRNRENDPCRNCRISELKGSQAINSVSLPRRWERWGQERWMTRLWCSGSSAAEPGLGSNSLHPWWVSCHNALPVTSPINGWCFLASPWGLFPFPDRISTLTLQNSLNLKTHGVLIETAERKTSFPQGQGKDRFIVSL